MHYRQDGVVGYKIGSLDCVAYDDADVAGCFATTKSTTRGHLCIEGPNTHFPLHALSRIHDSIATSTPDAEIVSANTVVRTILILDIDCWGIVLEKAVRMRWDSGGKVVDAWWKFLANGGGDVVGHRWGSGRTVADLCRKKWWGCGETVVGKL